MLNIFHDLRSPLFVLRGYTDMLQPQTEQDASRKQLMQERLAFLSKLIEDLFLTAKLEEGQITFELEPVELCSLCEDIVRGGALAAQQRSIVLQWEGSPCTVLGDAFRLRQACRTSWTTPCNITPSGGSIRFTCGAGEGLAAVTVQNTGQGIAPEDLPHVFERYYQVRRPGDRDSTGLGLSIALSIARSHGGDITAQSIPGQGASFLRHHPPLPAEEIEKSGWGATAPHPPSLSGNFFFKIMIDLLGDRLCCCRAGQPAKGQIGDQCGTAARILIAQELGIGHLSRRIQAGNGLSLGVDHLALHVDTGAAEGAGDHVSVQQRIVRAFVHGGHKLRGLVEILILALRAELIVAGHRGLQCGPVRRRAPASSARVSALKARPMEMARSRPST